jgi:hypothetical protein
MNIYTCGCHVECRRGDTKHLEDHVLGIGSICGRVAVEEEVTIPGLYDVLKGDGGGIYHTVL